MGKTDRNTRDYSGITCRLFRFREKFSDWKVFLDRMAPACYNITRSDERHLIERAFSSVGQSLRLITG